MTGRGLTGASQVYTKYPYVPNGYWGTLGCQRHTATPVTRTHTEHGPWTAELGSLILLIDAFCTAEPPPRAHSLPSPATRSVRALSALAQEEI